MIGKVQVREIETKVIPATGEALSRFSRQELRDYASCLGVERGRSKEDTIRNLIASGKATMLAQLGD